MRGERKYDDLTGNERFAALRSLPVCQVILPADPVAFFRHRYDLAGKYCRSTLSEWAIAFSNDSNPEKELMFWARVGIVLDKMDPDDAEKMIKDICRRSFDPEVAVAFEVDEAWNAISKDACQSAIRNAFNDMER